MNKPFIFPSISKTYYSGAAFLLVLSLLWLHSFIPAFSSAVTVSATVASSVTCSTASASTAFGTLTSGSITTATPNATTTLSCNTGTGCTLSINDANGGLATSSPAYTITSTSTALSAGTEGYGIQAATSTAGSGGVLGINAIYLVTGNNVGKLNVGATTLASSSASVSGRVVDVTHKAAISGTTQAAAYTDTITYSCAGN